MNRMLVVSIWMNSWCGCLRPPCGGTMADVPSRIFSSACWTPSPDTSRVIEGSRSCGRPCRSRRCRRCPSRPLDVEVGGLEQLERDVLDVLADVAGLGQRGRVGDGERHVRAWRAECLREQGLAAAGRAKQQNVRFGQLDFVATANRGGLALILNTPVMVVDGHGEDLLGLALTDDVIIEESSNLTRIRQVVEAELGRFGEFLFDDLVAEIYALVADVDARARNELLDLLLRLTAKRTLQQLACVTEFGHCCYPSTSNEFVVLHSARPRWPGARHCAPPADSSRGYRREPEVSGSGRPGPPPHATKSLCR